MKIMKDPNSAWIRRRNEAIIQAPCPEGKGGCGALAGAPCLSPSGRPTRLHGARVREAGDRGLYKPE